MKKVKIYVSIKDKEVRLNTKNFIVLLFIVAILGNIVLNGVRFVLSDLLSTGYHAEASASLRSKETTYFEHNFNKLDIIEKDLKTTQEKLNKSIEKIHKYEEKINAEIKEKEKYEHNLYLLAKIIHCEEGTQNIKRLNEKIAVGIIVLNRVDSPKFPNSIEEVIKQKNQFSPTLDGSWEKKEPQELDYIAAEIALKRYNLKGEHGENINDCLYFLNPELSASKNVKWFRNKLTYVDSLGGHDFYKEKTN